MMFLISNKPFSNLETCIKMTSSLNFKDIKCVSKRNPKWWKPSFNFHAQHFDINGKGMNRQFYISIFKHHILRSVRTCEYNHDFMGVEWLKTSSHLLEWLNKIELMKMVFSVDKMLSTAWKPFVHAMFLARNILMDNPSVDVSAAIDNVRRTLSSTIKLASMYYMLFSSLGSFKYIRIRMSSLMLSLNIDCYFFVTKIGQIIGFFLKISFNLTGKKVCFGKQTIRCMWIENVSPCRRKDPTANK